MEIKVKRSQEESHEWRFGIQSDMTPLYLPVSMLWIAKMAAVVHILRVARVARVNVETRKALRGVARAELGRAGLGGGSRKSRMKAPKFEKWHTLIESLGHT